MAPSEGLTKVDVSGVYKWHKLFTDVKSGHKMYRTKIEYLESYGKVVTYTVTCLDEPMADYDITQSLSGDERDRVFALAEADLESQS